MIITWRKASSYEWVGYDEKKNYCLHVYQMTNRSPWDWSVFDCGERMNELDEYDEDDTEALTADEAKLRAEKALTAFLDERDNVNAVTPKEGWLQDEIDRNEFYHPI